MIPYITIIALSVFWTGVMLGYFWGRRDGTKIGFNSGAYYAANEFKGAMKRYDKYTNND